jgi:hypothetical protein
MRPAAHIVLALFFSFHYFAPSDAVKWEDQGVIVTAWFKEQSGVYWVIVRAEHKARKEILTGMVRIGFLDYFDKVIAQYDLLLTEGAGTPSVSGWTAAPLGASGFKKIRLIDVRYAVINP